ncbi:MAG: CorA family divalent cation transporter, partial [Deltaproteobacteria bacterium]
IPLTFIVGLYGMNFSYMHELKRHWGYPAVLLLMLSISIFMLSFFRKKKWL